MRVLRQHNFQIVLSLTKGEGATSYSDRLSMRFFRGLTRCKTLRWCPSPGDLEHQLVDHTAREILG